MLEIYSKPYDSRHPVVCMDEQPVQWIGETRVAIPATKTHAKRVDYEYERRGIASIFMFAESLCAFRQATARPQRTKSDWALEVAHLLDTHYAKCQTVTLVSDNLNTHTIGAFYEAFPPEQARACGPAQHSHHFKHFRSSINGKRVRSVRGSLLPISSVTQTAPCRGVHSISTSI